MKKYIPYILIAIILLVAGFIILQFSPETTYSNTESSTIKSSTPASTEIYQESGGEDLCAGGAQKIADSLNKSALQTSQSFTLPATFYTVVFSHYATSQNSCYFELHNQLPMPNNAVSNNDTLYIMRGPSEYEVNSMAGGNEAEIAECIDDRCQAFYPIEKDFGWSDQYNRQNAPSISQEDYLTLVAKDKISQ
jgi:hypothetical protein